MLTVYRASAGSGKTHLLTGTYLTLLFSENTSFDNILAVTFTNKATEEMKRRIVEQLYLLTSEPEQSDYIDMLSNTFRLNVSEVRKKALKILVGILHNYSDFNVSTIDSFFQQTTRSFTREIGLQGGYQIELDSEKVRTQAIDNMIEGLEKNENKDILEWLMGFANERIESGKDWNFKKELFSISREVLTEDFKKNSEQIRNFTADKKKFEGYIKEIKSIKENFEDLIRELGKRAVNLMESHGLRLEDTPYGKSGGFAAFIKWANGSMDAPGTRFIALKDDVSKWCSKKATAEIKSAAQAAFDGGLNDCVNQGLSLFEDSMMNLYNSACATLTYIYTLGVLSDIDRNMHEYAKENNIMLISDTTELLNKIIDGSDTPFIYEKIGNRFQHFMIDEFQDTSGMQWDNFKPLIEDSLANAEDFKNLIVGDVKQSIYRWRNSDWNLLHTQLKQFAEGRREDFFLTTNWRSCRNIVEFNNTFFTIAASMLQDKYNKELIDAGNEDRTNSNDGNIIREAYDDIYQFVPKHKLSQEGHVKIEFIEAENEESLNEQVLEKIPETLIELQKSGYALKDIAILVRKGKEGPLIADYLLKYKAEHPDSGYRFDIISNEALIIGHAPVIHAIVSFLRFLYNSEIKINREIAGLNITAAMSEMNSSEVVRDWFNNDEKTRLKFEEKVLAQAEQLRTLPLFEMIEKIIEELVDKDNASDMVYVQAFQDLVLDFTTGNTADLSAFLRWWDESGFKKNISTPDSQDAIRIMTIHKSKGLGYRAVIVPFANWGIDHNPTLGNIVWCKPAAEPFNQIPLIPVKYSKKLAKSIYSHEYFTEKRQAFIDNLNMAYVAFTRSKDELIIFAKKEKKPESLTHIGALLQNAIESGSAPKTDKDYLSLNTFYRPEDSCFEVGEWWKIKNDRKKDDNELRMSPYVSVNPTNRLQLRLHGKGYFNDKKARIYGNMMHDILSAIRFDDDIEEAVDQHVRSGDLQEEEGYEMKERISDLISSDVASQWFSPEAEVFNETEILIANGTFLRPDRVVKIDDTVIVIDYKFGKIERKSYTKQVHRYMQQLNQMGYTKVEGYIWYVELNKTVRVDLASQNLTLF